MDSKRSGARDRARARVSLKSRPRKLKIIEPDLLMALSPYAVVFLSTKSFSSPLKVVKPYDRFF